MHERFGLQRRLETHGSSMFGNMASNKRQGISLLQTVGRCKCFCFWRYKCDKSFFSFIRTLKLNFLVTFRVLEPGTGSEQNHMDSITHRCARSKRETFECFITFMCHPFRAKALWFGRAARWGYTLTLRWSSELAHWDTWSVSAHLPNQPVPRKPSRSCVLIQISFDLDLCRDANTDDYSEASLLLWFSTLSPLLLSDLPPALHTDYSHDHKATCSGMWLSWCHTH